MPESNRRLTSSDAPERLCATERSASASKTHVPAYHLATQPPEYARNPSTNPHQSIKNQTSIINNRWAMRLLHSLLCQNTAVSALLRTQLNQEVLQNSKSRIRDAESARDLSDPSCEMENGSPAKPSGGSCVGQIYIIKRINTRHSPSTSQPQPHGPDAHMHFIWSSPLS